MASKRPLRVGQSDSAAASSGRPLALCKNLNDKRQRDADLPFAGANPHSDNFEGPFFVDTTCVIHLRERDSLCPTEPAVACEDESDSLSQPGQTWI